MAKLSDAAIAERLAALTGWERGNGMIQKTYQFHDFAESMEFVNRVADVAERANHHPDILVQWNRVSLTLSTHSDGGLTTKDFDLAQTLDHL